MRLKLPDVTLVMMDCTCPELARLAVMDTLELIEPDDILVVSNAELDVPNARAMQVPAWQTVQEYCLFLWYHLPFFVHTKFFLNIQWDGWVIDHTMWDPEFLEYDYIGAPWWYDTYNVGNGTGIRSIKLMRFLAENRKLLPVEGKEDELLGRVYRPILERQGFRWAPEKLAAKFSVECTRPSVSSKHFMFHDSFNFPAVLPQEKFEQRLRLMQVNKYICRGKKLLELEQKRSALVLDRLA
jgi:uncharacterized protein DUF5672